MKGGYDAFFKAAQEAKASDRPVKKKPASSSQGREKPSAAKASGRSEEELRRMFKMKKPRRRPVFDLPIPTLSFVFIGFVFCAWLALDPSLLDTLSETVEVSWGGRAQAAGKKDQEKTSPPKAVNKEQSAETVAPESPKPTSEKSSFSKEELSYFSKLNDRKKELDLREKELNELERELHKQRQEVEVRIGKLEEMRNQIAKVLEERVEIDQKKVSKLVEFYSNMKPKQAAEIMGTINEDLAVEVLGQMKKKDAAAIMNLLEPKKARVLSEKFAGYQRR